MTDERRLFNVWSWLPAFHAAADAPHLPTASRRLGVSVSALSRSITQLESTIGRRLFHRVKGRLELNQEGRALKQALAGAVDELTAALTSIDDTPTTVVRVAVSHSISQRLLARAILGALPDAVRSLHGCSDEEAHALVAAGEVDLALVGSATPSARVTVEPLGELSRSVFCGAGHPLFGAASVDEATLRAHPFVATRAEDSAGGTVALFVTQEDSALELCLSGRLLAVLPDPVADPHLGRGQLRRLGEATPRSVSALFAHDRRAAPAARAIADAVRAQLTLRGPTAPSRFQLGDELLQRGEWDAANAGWSAAARGAKLSPPERGEWHLRRLHLALLRGDWPTLSHLASQPPASLPPVGRAWREALIALGDCFRGKLTEAARRVAAAESALEEIDGEELQRGALMVHRALGNLALARGRADEARVAYAAGLRACERIGERWHRSIALYNLGDADLHAGDLERASALFDEATREKLELGDRWGRTYVQHGRALVYLFRGQPLLALREAAEGLALAVDIGDGRFLPLLHLVAGRGQLALGDAAEAERAFQFAARAAARAHASSEELQAQLGLVYASLRADRARVAQRDADRVRRMARRLRSPEAEAAALLASAAVARRADRAGDAERLEREAAARATLPARSPWRIV
jgi:DNA-binding transcriptional LysR family regulator